MPINVDSAQIQIVYCVGLLRLNEQRTRVYSIVEQLDRNATRNANTLAKSIQNTTHDLETELTGPTDSLWLYATTTPSHCEAKNKRHQQPPARAKVNHQYHSTPRERQIFHLLGPTIRVGHSSHVHVQLYTLSGARLPENGTIANPGSFACS